MKRLITLLLTAAVTCQLYAQKNTTLIYNSSRPGELPINIELWLNNGIRMTLEVSKISQLESINNMDSLLHKVWANLLPVKDSISKPFVSRRIDYSSSAKYYQFRILEHASNGTTYKYTNDKLLQTKTEQDTLRIMLQTFDKIIYDSVKLYNPFFITFTLGKIEDIVTITPGIMDSAVVAILSNAKAGNSNKESKRITASYNAVNNKWSALTYARGNTKKVSFEPDLYIGFQYARGVWVPSAALGVQFIYGDYFGERNVFKLLWEPHFFFSRNVSNSLETDRNDFITARYYYYDKDPNPDNYFPLSFSIGYLIRRKGDWYEKNTFKFSVPGVQYKNVSLEPEFFFDHFFKHFSPSLKLNFNID